MTRLGRRHHPIVWAGIAGGVIVGPDRGLGRWAFAVGPLLVALLVMVWFTRARVSGWTAERRARVGAVLLGTAGFVAAGAIVAGVAGALVGGCLAWLFWHAVGTRAPRA